MTFQRHYFISPNVVFWLRLLKGALFYILEYWFWVFRRPSSFPSRWSFVSLSDFIVRQIFFIISVAFRFLDLTPSWFLVSFQILWEWLQSKNRIIYLIPTARQFSSCYDRFVVCRCSCQLSLHSWWTGFSCWRLPSWWELMLSQNFLLLQVNYGQVFKLTKMIKGPRFDPVSCILVGVILHLKLYEGRPSILEENVATTLFYCSNQNLGQHLFPKGSLLW